MEWIKCPEEFMKELGKHERIIKMSAFEDYHSQVISGIDTMFTKLSDMNPEVGAQYKRKFTLRKEQ